MTRAAPHHRLLALVAVVVTVGCSLPALPEGEGDTKAADPAEDGEQTATDTASSTDVAPGDGSTECHWIAAESYPEQYSWSCVLAADGKVGKTVVKTAAAAANAATLRVTVDGEKLAASAYVYDPAAGTLTITHALIKPGAKIEVRYTALMDEDGPQDGDGVHGRIVDQTGLDGCGFMIQLDNGKNLEPTNLAESFRTAGLEVVVHYDVETDLVSACMAGEIVTITGIKAVNGVVTGDDAECPGAREEWTAVVEDVLAAPRTCSADADCRMFGPMPKSGCPALYPVAKTAVTAAIESRASAAAAAINAHCAMPVAMCAAFFPDIPRCAPVDTGGKACSAELGAN